MTVAELFLAPTFGWDIVYAARIEALNDQLAKDDNTSFVLEIGDGSATVSGTLGRCKIAPSGKSTTANMALTIEGRLQSLGREPLTFCGDIIIQAMLDYRPKSVDTPHLQVLTVGSPRGKRTDDGLAPLVVSMDLIGDIDPLSQAAIKAGIEAWLTKNPAALDRPLALVDLAKFANTTSQNWLRPTFLAHAMCEGENGVLLAVLAMTQERAPHGLDRIVSSNSVRPGFDAAFLLAPHLILDSIILPALPQAFKGLEVGDFQLSPETGTLALTEPKQIQDVKYQGETFNPTLLSFSVSFQGTQLVCQAETSVPIEDGVVAHTAIKTLHGLTVVDNGRGEKCLFFTDLAEPEIRHWNLTDPDIDKLHAAVGTAIAVAGVVTAFFTAGVSALVLVAAATLVGGIVTTYPYLVAAWSATTAPQLDLTAGGFTGAFAWENGDAFTVANVDLADCLRLSGTPWQQHEILAAEHRSQTPEENSG